MIRELHAVLRSFTKAEAAFFILALALAAFSSVSLGIITFLEKTESIAIAGGVYREGIVGQPTFINPVLEGSNEVDHDLIKLLFADTTELKERIAVSKNGTVWNIRLKENILWDDGEPITSDDFIFTLRAIQDPDVRSPRAPLFEGVDASRVSEREFSLTLRAPYAFFEETIGNLKPIPKHIFGALPAPNLSLSEFNLEPIGSGPYRVEKMEKRRDGFIAEYRLRRNDRYAGKKPYLDMIVIKFFQREDDGIAAMNASAIDGIGGVGAANLPRITTNHETTEFHLPRYYAVFLNPYAEPVLTDKNVRRAMDEAIAPDRLIGEVLDNHGLAVHGPLFPGMSGYSPNPRSAARNIDTANEILERTGWKRGDNGIREKISETGTGKNKETKMNRLEFTLVTPDIPFLVKTAEFIRGEWEKAGIKITIDAQSLLDIEERALKTRNYDMVLFGHILPSADLYSLWHSSEKFYPGLNLALYDNKTADAFLESIRKNFNEANRANDLESFESLIENDVPAIFLYSPSYLYIQKPSFEGFADRVLKTPADRFSNIEEWYVKTARVFK